MQKFLIYKPRIEKWLLLCISICTFIKISGNDWSLDFDLLPNIDLKNLSKFSVWGVFYKCATPSEDQIHYSHYKNSWLTTASCEASIPIAHLFTDKSCFSRQPNLSSHE